jgi:hypothetical protein
LERRRRPVPAVERGERGPDGADDRRLTVAGVRIAVSARYLVGLPVGAAVLLKQHDA